MEYMEMDRDLQSWIEQNANLIEEENFEALYQKALRTLRKPGRLTAVLLYVGVDPLEKLDYVPEGYLAGARGIKNLKLPSHITSISEGAFKLCPDLIQVNIPSGVTGIKAYTFESCTSLQNVALHPNIGSIEQFAFLNCSSLEHIILPANLTTLDGGAFCNCCNLESIVIPKGVTRIDSATFTDCDSLTLVTLPESLHYIEHEAFKFCENLNIIIFEGTKTQWKAIAKENSWKKGTPIKLVSCSDGDIKLA